MQMSHPTFDILTYEFGEVGCEPWNAAEREMMVVCLIHYDAVGVTLIQFLHPPHIHCMHTM